MEFPAWDPVLLDIPFLPIDIRWYGLMYVVGFLCAQWIFVRLARRGFFPVAPEHAPDLIFYCVFGVMLGGRTGYALFYDQSLLNPLEFVQVWKGGLAFHGGLAGVCVAVWLFCRRHRIGWARVADAAALGVCPGIFAVRFANFINGELYGRETTADTFGAMQFPSDPAALRALGLHGGMTMRDRELCIQVAYGKREFADVQEQLSKVDDLGRPIDWSAIEPRLDWQAVSARMVPGENGELEHLVPYRHPSQLYEGICEGLLVGVLLWIVYLLTRDRPLRSGRYAALFLLGYAVARFCLEFVRKPDEQFLTGGNDGTVLFGMTMGQTLTVGMVVGALLILCWPRKPEQPGATAADEATPPGGGGEPPASSA
ncbi:MAG: prolipoprotein diacylglyceryl transferase [Planctomycetes bacterium]|nr:prolipoprotein diacylglyceryl transferase [Planctomycetota bacterium]